MTNSPPRKISLDWRGRSTTISLINGEINWLVWWYHRTWRWMHTSMLYKYLCCSEWWAFYCVGRRWSTPWTIYLSPSLSFFGLQIYRGDTHFDRSWQRWRNLMHIWWQFSSLVRGYVELPTQPPLQLSEICHHLQLDRSIYNGPLNLISETLRE